MNSQQIITTKNIRNVAIIAHVDHGKTTLVTNLIKQSEKTEQQEYQNKQLDSNDLEKERGITIVSKNLSISYKNHKINLIDTPGHTDFGGEVERILSLADSVIILVDAVDGPMPQTRFVTQKAFDRGLKPIVVINKMDREGARPEWVIEQMFDLFDRLGGSDEQLDFTVIYASAMQGQAGFDPQKLNNDLSCILDTIIKEVPCPNADMEGHLQMQISSLDYSPYLGTIGIGRVHRGTITAQQNIQIIDKNGHGRNGRIQNLMNFQGLERINIEKAVAGDIVAISGIEPLSISDTICDQQNPIALPAISVDEPTVSMTFSVNDSPFAGKEGKHITSRKIKERLDQELIHNVALRVEESEDSNSFVVSGRGELHLSILIETMRREGYELAVSRPQVIIKNIDGQMQEPYEFLILDIEEVNQGAVMTCIANRKGELKNMTPDGKGRIRLDYIIPARGLIGLRNDFLTITSGSGILHHVFDHYGAMINSTIGERHQGVLISNCDGKALAFSLWKLQERGRMLIEPQTEVYEGMVVGIHNRDNDLVVNVTKGKQLTNMRASGSDENILLTPAIRMTLEKALEFIANDELVEVTPKSIRIRKKFLKEHERKAKNKE